MIRNIRKSDLKDLVSIYREYFERDFTEDDINKIENTISLIEKYEYTFGFVFEDNGEVLGYINGHVNPFPLVKGNELYITELFIKQKERGQGIGSKLLLEIEKTAKEQNCVRMLLNNSKDAESYKKEFYRKNGFDERENMINFVKRL